MPAYPGEKVDQDIETVAFKGINNTCKAFKNYAALF